MAFCVNLQNDFSSTMKKMLLFEQSHVCTSTYSVLTQMGTELALAAQFKRLPGFLELSI